MDDTKQPLLSLYQGLQQQVEQRPYETLAIAAGIGFVLGGGLVSKLGVKLLATGMRLGLSSTVAPMITSLLYEVTQSQDRSPQTHSSAQQVS